MQYLKSISEFHLILNEFLRISKRIIYIGDIETVDHTISNKKHYKYESNLKHLTISKKEIEKLNINIKFDNLFCSVKSRYNCIIDKNCN